MCKGRSCEARPPRDWGAARGPSGRTIERKKQVVQASRRAVARASELRWLETSPYRLPSPPRLRGLVPCKDKMARGRGVGGEGEFLRPTSRNGTLDFPYTCRGSKSLLLPHARRSTSGRATPPNKGLFLSSGIDVLLCSARLSNQMLAEYKTQRCGVAGAHDGSAVWSWSERLTVQWWAVAGCDRASAVGLSVIRVNCLE
jgi:hypothetical protein